MENKITFNFELMKFEGITIDQVKFWENAYQDVDVVGIITKKAPAWLDAHEGKTYKNWKAFLNGWFSRDQEKYDQFKKQRQA